MRIWSDERGISEEFSSITAIIVVTIGISIIFLIVGGVYISNKDIENRIEKYQMADYIFNKIFSPDSFLYKDGVILGEGMINKSKFIQFSHTSLPEVYGINYQLILSVKHDRITWGMLNDVDDEIALSKNVPVYIDEAHVLPGKLTIVIGGVK